MALPRTLLWVLFAITAYVATPAAVASPQSGWWWNPAESGRGFFIEISDNFAFIGAYVYAPDGRADWVVSQGTMASPTSFSGRLLSFRGGQTLVGDYRAPGTPTDVGALSIQFIDDTHATLTWPGGTAQIERLAFDTGIAEYAPKTGWWWNDQQSGTGWSIEVQGDTLFLVGFMYAETGNPVWYYSSGPLSTFSSYSGTLLQFANGQAIGAPYRAPSAPVSAGTISIEFSAADKAEMTISDGTASPGVQVKRTQTRTITRTLPAPAIVAPQRWEGLFSHVRHLTSNVSGVLNDATVRITADAVTWTRVPGASSPSYAPSGSVKLRYTGTETSPAGGCTVEGEQVFPLTASDGELALLGSTYVMLVRMTLTIELITTCTVFDLTTTVSHPYTEELEILAPVGFAALGWRDAYVIDDRIRGHPRDILFPGPGITITRNWLWYFVAVR